VFNARCYLLADYCYLFNIKLQLDKWVKNLGIMTRKLDRAFVKNEIENVGYSLNSTYINSQSKLTIICDKGHTNQLAWSKWKSGSRCKTCKGIEFANSLRNDPNHIKQEIEAEGWLVHDLYHDAKVKMKVTCPRGHETSICWSNWKAGKRCGLCARVNNGNKLRLTSDFVKVSVEAENYVLNSVYKGSKTHLDMTCKNGHSISMTWDNWNAGKRCGKCNGKHKTTEEVSKAFALEGCTLLSQYERNNKKLDFICPQGHRHSITWADWISGSRCAKCAGYGFNPNKPASLYYLKFIVDSTPYYKLGITNRTIQERYARERLPYTILKENRYLFGSLAKQKESALLKKFSNYLYKGLPILKDGNTEIFIKDVLKLDA
jgi:hypothetical protein